MEGTRRRGSGRASERKLGGAWRFMFERRRSHVKAIIRLYEQGGMFPPQSTAASNEKIHKVKLNFMRESMCVRERDGGKPVNGSSHWVGGEQRKKVIPMWSFVSLSLRLSFSGGENHAPIRTSVICSIYTFMTQSFYCSHFILSSNPLSIKKKNQVIV